MNNEIEKALEKERTFVHSLMLSSTNWDDFVKAYEERCASESKKISLAKQLHVKFQVAKSGSWTWDALPNGYREAILAQAEWLLSNNPNLVF